jgi:hypothetical protein
MHVGLKIPHRDAARLRLGRPSALDNMTEHELRKLGLPTTSPEEVPWREGEGFVWDDSTCHEVVWRGLDGGDKSAGHQHEEESCGVPQTGAEFATAEPRIILLLLFFHPRLTSVPIC